MPLVSNSTVVSEEKECRPREQLVRANKCEFLILSAPENGDPFRLDVKRLPTTDNAQKLTGSCYKCPAAQVP